MKIEYYAPDMNVMRTAILNEARIDYVSAIEKDSGGYFFKVYMSGSSSPFYFGYVDKETAVSWWGKINYQVYKVNYE